MGTHTHRSQPLRTQPLATPTLRPGRATRPPSSHAPSHPRRTGAIQGRRPQPASIPDITPRPATAAHPRGLGSADSPTHPSHPAPGDARVHPNPRNIAPARTPPSPPLPIPASPLPPSPARVPIRHSAFAIRHFASSPDVRIRSAGGIVSRNLHDFAADISIELVTCYRQEWPRRGARGTTRRGARRLAAFAVSQRSVPQRGLTMSNLCGRGTCSAVLQSASDRFVSTRVRFPRFVFRGRPALPDRPPVC
jgi:hypothetical protein